MTGMTPQLASPLEASLRPQREDDCHIWRAADPHERRSSVESGFEPGIFRSQRQDLITRLPQPAKKCVDVLRHAFHVCIYNYS
ncbi:hypothetical protein AVEN_252579-1 [Araneus ventricosus]|uniref:Uncharacterized protein n=1 Tax=Araneus ventricosus TaxID=182803 RepID=A0A4Y2ARE6_ARAVE|nr:hypothetical protein AVEN_252579-1 [Araneus ventricosus]